VAVVFLSAAHKSSGKTTISVGLAAALARRGLRVQSFKKGPDYIDPLWLQKATGRPCYNLDYNTQSHEEIDALFQDRLASVDIALIEGNKGLYDGVALDGHDSNAALAAQLNAPVILVIDVTGVTRGIAPLLVGYQAFGPEVNIAGVIFNKVAGPRQEDKLRAAVERYTDISVMGAAPRDNNMLTKERHLGLIPPAETGEAFKRISKLATIVEQNVDISQLLSVAQQFATAGQQTDPPLRDVKATAHAAMVEPAAIVKAKAPARPKAQSTLENPHNQPDQRTDIKIAVARDSAFGFYYADDLEALRQAGAELVFFNALEATRLPDADGLFIGGGFPETHMQALEANGALRADIRQKAQDGLPIYAECGGLMYLAQEISWRGDSAKMVGVIPGRITMHDRPQGRGLVRLAETKNHLWPGLSGKSKGEGLVMAHEFHYASLDGLPKGSKFAQKVQRGHGIDGAHDGVIIGNVLAGFCHHRNTEQNQWTQRFVAFVRQCKKNA